MVEEKVPEKPEPMEVKVVNEPKKQISIYDSTEDMMYEDLGISKEDIEEFENGDSSS